MRVIIFLISISIILVSCTEFKENHKNNYQSCNEVSHDDINTSLKVINIIVDENDFENMYDNYLEDIEIIGEFNMYLNNEPLIENEEVELQIKGATSAAFELKSLGVKFDNTYDNEDNDYNLIHPDLLPFHSVKKVKSIRLRNSGNDFQSTMLKDMTYTKLAIDAQLNIDLMYAEQVVVFINDEFYGLLNMRTETNKHGLSRLYNVSKNDITLGKMDVSEAVFKDGDEDKYNAFIQAIEEENVSFLLTEVDIPNFIDYMIFESFIANLDWPRTNVRFFAINDGPFRFVLFDLDLASLDDLDLAPMNYIMDNVQNPISDLFHLFYQLPDFKLQFDNRYQELLDSGMFSVEKFEQILNTYKDNIRHIMPLQIEKYDKPETMVDWHLNTDHLKLNYRERLEYFE